ncbi:hypothetical protein C2G38_2158141 [Gigaspora rosea]|uniref:Uncharacterized protein n=1 Tax=Gigaspora rosea TaxID=44941 RepID=A0A397W2S0_9GLOM|nr:hypothetical protein C2G38_2158141 [Gigaspora rosea]
METNSDEKNCSSKKGSLGKNENSTSVAKEKVLEEKNTELDSEDLIDDYLVEEFLVEEEKGAIREPSNAGSLVKDKDKTFMYRHKSAEIETINETGLIVPYPEKESEVKEIRNKISDEYDAFDYSQRSVDTKDKIGGVKDATKSAEETSIEYQESVEVDNCSEMKLDRKEKVRNKNDLKESEYNTLVKSDDRKNEYKLEAPLEREALRRACVEWNKRVDEFQMTVSRSKTSIRMKPAEEPLSDKEYYRSRIVDKNKAFDYYQEAANMGILTEYTILNIADAGSANGMFMVNNCYLKEKDSNGLDNLKLCSQNSASAIEEKKVSIDMDPIEDKCSETKDLEDDYQQSLNINSCTNSTASELKNNIKNNCAGRGQIKKISLEKDVGNSVNSGVAVTHKISNGKDEKECNKKKVVVSHSRIKIMGIKLHTAPIWSSFHLDDSVSGTQTLAQKNW